MNTQAKITPSFCTGFGQFDTRKSDGQPYQDVTGAVIAGMVQDPPSVDKTKAQWFIPSDYRAADARSHDAQRDRGSFWFLPLDVDCNDLSLDDLTKTLSAVLGDCARLVYATRSSKPDNRKWRALIPLHTPLPGEDYADTVTAFFDLLEGQSQGVLIPDRALARPGQLVYLPNRGDHYEHEIAKGKRLTLDAGHPVIVRREDTRAQRKEAEAKAAAWREWKARQAPTDTSSIVDAFNSAETVANLLAKYGYQQAGQSNDWRSPFQQSGSYATRDCGAYWVSLSASDAAAGLGQDSKAGQRFGDAFDLFAHFEHGGNFGAAVKAYAKEIGQDYRTKAKAERKAIAKLASPEINPAAVNLAGRIAKGIRKALPELTADPFIDPLIVRDMIEGAFWSGAKSRLFLLNEAECLVQFVVGDAWKFLCRRFGSPVDVAEIITQLEAVEGPLKPSAEDAARKAINAATVGPIIDHLKYENQRDAVEWCVDMFSTRSRLDLSGDIARIILTHRPLVAAGKADPACLADYRQHFPLLDEMLEYIVAARFALDRKKSYLWMLAASDWGKGFLMGVLSDLGLVVQMSVKEIEAVFEGKPSGRRPEDFKRAMVLAVDEFKTVKSELKQLQSEIQLAPKYQLTARVEIFTKLFLSAESVGSLVGEHGVEDQFANRMSMLTGSGTLNSRPAYEADQGKYYRSVRAYVAAQLNTLIAQYQALGRDRAEMRADKYLNAFIARHGLDQHFERLSASYPEIAREAVDWCSRMGKTTSGTDGACYLTHANKALDDYLADHYSHSEISTLRRRKMEILAAMSADGRGNTAHRINGRLSKAVKLKT